MKENKTMIEKIKNIESDSEKSVKLLLKERFNNKQDDPFEEAVEIASTGFQLKTILLTRYKERVIEMGEITEKLFKFESLSFEEQQRVPNDELMELSQSRNYIQDIFVEFEYLAQSINSALEIHKKGLTYVRDYIYSSLYESHIKTLIKECDEKGELFSINDFIDENFSEEFKAKIGFDSDTELIQLKKQYNKTVESVTKYFKKDEKQKELDFEDKEVIGEM